MGTEVVAALIGAGVSLAIALLTYVQVRQSASQAAEAQHRQSVATATLERELAALAGEQAQQLTRLQAELDQRKAEREQRNRREELAYRFREPLARAAYELQSPLWNILQGRFIETFLVHGTERERQYAIENTVFLIAQYFAWTEIIRREIQFIDLGQEDRTRDLSHLQDSISNLWGTDRRDFERRFRVWAGEQRAIGEMLIEEGPRGPTCAGYGRFLQILQRGDAPLLTALCEDTASLPQLPVNQRLRMLTIQHSLIALLTFLDSEFKRFPAESRTRAWIPGIAQRDEDPPHANSEVPSIANPAPLTESRGRPVAG
jgi:hypothetical protein